MLGENMIMAFNAIRANKLRSLLTMLGIIIGIGSVIAIVSIGDTMRGMFADLYKDVGITQAYVGIGYWVEDEDVDGVLKLIEEHSQTREETINPGIHPGISFEQPIEPVNITVGGATVFVLPVDQFLHF